MDSLVWIEPDKRRALAEILFVSGCVLIAEWAIIPVFGRHSKVGMIPIAFVLTFAFFSHRVRGESLRVLGLTKHNFGHAMRLLLYWMIPASVVLAGTGWALGSLRFNPPRSLTLLIGGQVAQFLWGLMQQYALQALINRRAQDVLGVGAGSILLVALIFAGCHLPNIWLTFSTFLGGILWAAVYQKAPNLFALALSHSAMTSVLTSSIPAAALHGLRVGYNYY